MLLYMISNSFNPFDRTIQRFSFKSIKTIGYDVHIVQCTVYVNNRQRVVYVSSNTAFSYYTAVIGTFDHTYVSGITLIHRHQPLVSVIACVCN